MLKNKGGFTLIELIMIIVILGILAAVAIPKYQDMATEARQAVVEGSAGALKSAAVITFAKRKGVKDSLSAILAQTVGITGTEQVSVSGTCASANTIVYNIVQPAINKSVDLSEYCNP